MTSTTLAQLADHINQGHPFCPQHSNQRRAEMNFECSDILAVDIDKGWKFDQALADPYIQKYAALLYTTPSHTQEAHKFRIVFHLNRSIKSVIEMRAAYQGVIRKFGGDEACKDACRLFFGSKGSNPIILGNVLSNERLDELIALSSDIRISDHDSGKKNDRIKATCRSAVSLEKDQEVELVNGQRVPLVGLANGTSLFCPVHHDHKPSAFVVTNKQGVNGVRCQSCVSSFWPPSPFGKKYKPYDFYAIEGIVRTEDYYQTPANFYDDDDVAEHPDLLDETPGERTSHIFAEQYLPDIPFADGVTFVRSPKGSGKTEWLTKVVERCRIQGKSVLLVGHRKTLIQSIAQRLGLTCYFYNSGASVKNNPPENYYAICVDSIGKLLNPKVDRYDVVIIDESEQVFSHLTSDTLKNYRRICYTKLIHYLRNAQSILLLDADLGPISVEGAYQSVGKNGAYQFYLNDYKESRCDFHSYISDTHLTQEMLDAIEAGGRHYVTTNSKIKAELLREVIRQKLGDDVKVLLVTSATTGDDDVMNFMNNITTEILNYDVVIASPTLGTGIDITFPNAAQHIDNVFGFYVPRVNTHFDIDQQISRVRHPKAIKVWVAPEHFGFESDPEVIRAEIIDNGVINDMLIGYASDGEPTFDETYLSVYAHVTAVSRASKNSLRANLISLRERNGWTVKIIQLVANLARDGKNQLVIAKDVIERQRIDSICNAKSLVADGYLELSIKHKNGIKLSIDDERSMRNYEIQSFYRVKEVTPEFVVLDDHGGCV